MISYLMAFVSSTLFHWFGPISRRVMQFTKRLDYSFAISSTFTGPFAGFFYNYYDRAWLINLMFGFGASLTLTCFILNLGEWIHLTKNYFKKVMLFSLAGFTSVFVPNASIFIKRLFFGRGQDELLHHDTLLMHFTIWGSLLIGVFCFATKYPEKAYPGKFNIIVSIF